MVLFLQTCALKTLFNQLPRAGIKTFCSLSQFSKQCDSRRGNHSQVVVAGNFKQTPWVTILPRAPPTRVSKRHTTGRSINSLTFSTQHTRSKHNRSFEVGVSTVETSRQRDTSPIRRVRCLWCWISVLLMNVQDVPLTLVLMETYVTLTTTIGH